MNLFYDEQLVTTSLTVTFHGELPKINDVIVDTGSSRIVISPGSLGTIGVKYENGGTISVAYGIGGSVLFYKKHGQNTERFICYAGRLNRCRNVASRA